MSDRDHQSLAVRPASTEDESTLFHWRNLPWVIELGASRSSVAHDQHHAWFAETLERQSRCLFIVEIDNQPAGMVRYDFVSDATVEISIYLMPDFVGKGLGTQAFVQTVPLLLSWRDVNQIVARVLSTNSRSLGYFTQLGFVVDDQKSTPECYVFSRPLPDIQHSRPFLGAAEAEAAASVIASGQLSMGPVAKELEQRWCDLTSMSDAACVSSGLAALRLALLALDVGPGDEVLMPAYSCVALLNAVLALDATPVLADIKEDDWTLSPSDVKQRVTNKTKAIIAVHLFGMPAAIPDLLSLSLPVVEDCAHGIGGSCNGRPFGGVGTVNISSFYATKMIAAGEGGIVAAHDRALINRVRCARDYGDQLPNRHYLNEKMTDIEAALAHEQVKRLPEMLSLRLERAERYDKWLAPLAERGLIVLPQRLPGRIWYRYTVRLVRHAAGAVCEWMAKHRVRVEQPVWDLRESAFWSPALEVSALAFDRVISLPLYPDLNAADQEIVCHTLSRCLEDL